MSESSPLTQEKLFRGFRRLGIGAGDILLVHSSLSSLGFVEGGAETVIDALLEAVSPGGSVMMPTLTGSEMLSASNPPVYDVANAACWTGRIPESFRKRAEAVRSLHPTHSVAIIGPHAEALARGHELCSTPCGEESPYGRLVESGGKVVLLGVNHNCSTLFHYVEEIAGLPYHMQEAPGEALIVLPDGEQRRVKIGLHLYGPARDFVRLEARFCKAGVQRAGKIGEALVRVVSARGMVACALDALKEDPEVLLKEGIHWPGAGK